MLEECSQEHEHMVQVVTSTVESRRGGIWWCVCCVCAVLAVFGLGWSSIRIATEGVGVLGVNQDVPWGLDIVHFVFWIGLGHAGTLISAVLLLAGQKWRSPIARAAELMTLCAVLCAAVFPLVHVGRAWMLWMIAPVPVSNGLWPNMSSPLMWDVLAISTYLILSSLYWFLGLLPDFAVMRDHCTQSWRKKLYGYLSLGWQGSGRQWVAYEQGSLLMAGILTPLVVSVHTVVSLDFAVTQVAGWHETILPLYFVAGAILSGMAVVQVVLLIVRHMKRDGVGKYVSDHVMRMTSRFVLALSLVMGCMYFWEHFSAMLTGGESWTHACTRMKNESWVFILMLVGNILLPQLYWMKRWRVKTWTVSLVSVGVIIGMWSERWFIVIGSLRSSLVHVASGGYSPSAVDVWMGVGSIAMFMVLYMVGMRLTPFFSLCDMRAHLDEERRRP